LRYFIYFIYLLFSIYIFRLINLFLFFIFILFFGIKKNLNDFNNVVALHKDVEASEKERTNVLTKRNLRRESLRRQDISDDDVEVIKDF
jgi:hypothetical protein